MKKTYTELCKLSTFQERFRYLKLESSIGEDTFGGHRILNQMLYTSERWRRLRREILLRDHGCDLGIENFPILADKLLVHHIEPITIDDIYQMKLSIFDPENLITTSFRTHNQIHFGNEQESRIILPIERTRNDTCPWKN